MDIINCKLHYISIALLLLLSKCSANDILGCGGFVKSHVALDFSKIEVGLYTKQGSLKEKTECAPTNGYYFLPLYEKGEYVLKVHPPAGWSFEPSQFELNVDGVSDKCSTGQDVNFSFNGFGITGRVITAGQSQGPSGIAVQLVDNSGAVRNTVTTVGGDFHFTPVIPGKYTLKATHPRWKLEPSQAIVQVKEGNTALPVGVLAVKGYDVSGSVTSFGSPISGVYVLLYSKEENPKFRVEGCNTALLQGVPDSPICHVKTDASGEFQFGLVPAGEYKLMALPTAPGQVAVTYNVKPQVVPFTVRHDSLFIKNAFEVTGFTVVGTVVSAPGKGLGGARVLLDGEPVGKSDSKGKFTLPNLHPGLYTVSFQHDECEIPPVQVSVETSGPTRVVEARASAWRVCGAVSPVRAWSLRIHAHAHDTQHTVTTQQSDGKWCTFLQPGVYTAKIDVSEQEQQGGLQFYPLSQKITVAHGPVEGITFSQLKARLVGTVECTAAACRSLPVTLRHSAADAGETLTVIAQDGKYQFDSVLPGTVEISVPDSRLCWERASHRVTVTTAEVAVPAFTHKGYTMHIRTTHDIEVEAVSASSRELWSVGRGGARVCAAHAQRYTLTPRGCHRFNPPQHVVDTSEDTVHSVDIKCVSHAHVVRVTCPQPADDLTLTVSGREVHPLTHAVEGGVHVYTHTLYLAEGEVSEVSAWSSSLLFSPPSAAVSGGADCNSDALTIRARPALTVAGKITPPVAGVLVTLTAEDVKQTMVTGADGAYRFGPLEASRAYTVSAEKESYVFSAPDQRGDISAHRLAEIHVRLVDESDGTPLQGGLVSVSGGSYRRTAVSGAEGALRFGALHPDTYYVKPHMKEYKFTPQHHLLHVTDGNTHELTVKGVRVSWSCMGSASWVSGAPAAALTVLAVPAVQTANCVQEEANTDDSGAFRIRGLLPECVYSLRLKDSAAPELSGLKLVKAPAEIRVSERKDVTDVSVVAWRCAALSDGAVRVHAPLQHYRTLRLTLAPAHHHTHYLLNTKIDPAGLSEQLNPGVLYPLPRLPADNKTYVLQLESSLSKATHAYPENAIYFTADGSYKHFTIEFYPKVKTSEQELRQTSFLLIPLGVCAWAAWWWGGALVALWPRARPRARTDRHERQDRHDLLDRASIDHILNTVNPPKKNNKKKLA